MTTDSAPESTRSPLSFARSNLLTRRWRPLVGTVSILVALLAQQQVGDSGARAAVLFALASIGAVVAFWGVDGSSDSPQNFLKRGDPRRARSFTKNSSLVSLRALRGSFLLGQSTNRVVWSLLSIALILTALSTWRFYALPPGNLAWGLHLASLIALITAAYAFNGWRDLAASRDPWSRGEVVAGVAILALATFLRLYQLGELPFGIWYDEAEYALEALRILDDPSHRPIFVGAINGPAHYLYLVAAAFQLFGPGVDAVRGVNVLLGIATVPAMYLTARELFDRRSALVAAALVAVSSWAITLSRFGMHSTSTTPLFALLTIGFLLRGLRTRRASDFVWSGLWLGMGLNFYTSFRLVVPVVGLFVLHWWVVQVWLRRGERADPLPSPPPQGEGAVDGEDEDSASDLAGTDNANDVSAPPLTGGRLGGGSNTINEAATSPRIEKRADPLPGPPPQGEGAVDGDDEEPVSSLAGASKASEETAPPPLWGRLGGGLFLFALAALLATAPLILFALTEPDIFWARVQKTFIFADKAPHERLPALLDNIRVHLLMFNVRGDPNGRHNLPGRPMLDAISGALFVLGVALAAVRVHRPRWALLLLWLGWTLLGGILSLSFEAPQSLRANGALPAAYLLAVVPIYLLGKTVRDLSPALPQRGRGPLVGHAKAQVAHDTTTSKIVNTINRLPFPSGGEGPGKGVLRHLPTLTILALLLPATLLNYRAYFVDWATDFAAWAAWSAPQTVAAHLLDDLEGDSVQPYLISYLDNHPTLRFVERMARERGERGPAWDYRRLETTDQLPLAWPDDQEVLLILDDQSRNLYEDARALYPNAATQKLAPDFARPVVYTVHLTREDIQSIEGLEMKVYPGDGEISPDADPLYSEITRALAMDLTKLLNECKAGLNGEPGSTRPHPPTPSSPEGKGRTKPCIQRIDDEGLGFTVEWTGVLRVQEYGLHRFLLDAPVEATLWIDEEPVLTPDQSAAGATLALGNHALRLRAVVPADAKLDAPLALSWQTPTSTPQILGGDALYHAPVTANGLLGRYYANGDWRGPPAYERVDRDFGVYYHLPEMARPYTIEWTGKLAAAESGRYLFALESIDESTLWIGGQEIVASPEPNELREAVVDLEAGLHDVRLRFADRTDHTHLNWYWTPPDGGRTIVPAAVLFPPQGSYERLDVPDLALTNLDASAALVAAEAGSGELEVVASGLESPSGIAALGERIYVTESRVESEIARLLVLDHAGNVERAVSEITLEGATLSLVEPFDLAASEATDTLYLLDAGLPALLVFNADGTLRQRLPVDERYLLSARGLAVEPLAQGDSVWIAGTRTGTAIAVNGETGEVGQEVTLTRGNGAAAAQPVDVALLPSGDLLHDNRLFVTDAAQGRLWNFTSAGILWRTIGLPTANTLNGPHLAADPCRRWLYLTEPEAARLIRYEFGGDGTELALTYWPLPPVGPQAGDAARKPVGVAVDGAGSVWVADRGAGEVLRLVGE